VTEDLETRARLLKAAEQLFAARGFKDVTVREICRAARANVAAVNYHFGDKLGLYRDALQAAIDAIRETDEAGRRAGAGRSPEEKLRRYLVVLLERALSPKFETVHRLIQREIDHPTQAMDALVEQAARPRLEYVSAVVAEMMGRDPAEPLVRRCVGSVFAQTFVYIRKNPIAERLGFVFDPTRENIEAAARHITAFSIGGIRNVMQPAMVASRARGREV
jgi:AcrR family transcriptional regulator